MLARLRKGFERLLEAIVVLLMTGLTAIIVAAVIFRKAGASLSWYDEVASVLMAWLTYYGAALAALKRAHIGFPGLVNAMQPSRRIPFLVIGEACVFGFFILLAWMGVHVLRILGGDTLVSLPQVPTRLTQSVIPIGAVLFLIAEVLSLPTLWQQAKSPSGFVDYELSAEEEVQPGPTQEVANH